MNKLLLVSNKNYVKPGSYFIEYHQDTKLEIEKDVSLSNVDYENHNLEIIIHDCGNMILNQVNKVKDNMNLTVILKNKCKASLNILILNEGENTVHISTIMEGNESSCKVKMRILNVDNGKINIICDGKVLENTRDNELLEDLKGLITSNDTIKISPNMEVLTSEVSANHLVTVGTFESDALFYLESKGLSKKLAKKLLVDSFINEVTNDNLKEQIKTEVITIE